MVRLLSDLVGDADFDGVELLAQPLLDHPPRSLHLLGKVLPRRGRQLKDGLERLWFRQVERWVEEDPRNAGRRRRRHGGLQKKRILNFPPLNKESVKAFSGKARRQVRS